MAHLTRACTRRQRLPGWRPLERPRAALQRAAGMPQGVAPSTSMGTDGGANQTTAHCENLSMCEEDPSYCQSSVSGIQGAILIFLMLYPPLIATLTPTLTRLHKKSYPHSRDRLLMPGLADSYDDADVLQSPRRTSLEQPGAHGLVEQQVGRDCRRNFQ